MHAIVITLTLLAAAQSPSTMASVAIFSANVERKWPADEREPFVTAEALRLMEAAATSIADDSKVNTGKVKDAIAAFAKARAALGDQSNDDERATITREALISGHLMIEALAAGLHRADAATKQRVAELKKSAGALDRKKTVGEQAGLMERYFHQAGELLRAMIAASST